MIITLSGSDALSQSGAVADLMQRSFPPDYGEAWNEQQLRGALILPGTFLYLAITDNIPAGFGLTRNVVDECELLLLAVTPEARGHSIGSQLLKSIFAHCMELGIVSIFLEMRANNDALHFYQRHNFNIIGQRTGYYRGANGQKFDALTFARKIHLC